jgi:orotate phosphoribosyltransferase
MNVPLTDAEGFLEGRVIQAGIRYDGDTKELLSSEKKILVVDDSVLNGTQMVAIKRKIEDAKMGQGVLYAAVYVKPGSQNVVDYFYEVIPPGRVFEWNVFHHGALPQFCVDVDGVLCRDPTAEENDDGEMYETFIQNVEPWIIPSKTIGWLVTCRLEKYRGLTEEWLAKHGVKYKHLIMMDFPDKESRVRSQSHAVYKAKVYKETEALLFIESSLRQALEIARLTGKEVLCMETRELSTPSLTSRNYHRLQRFLKLLVRDRAEALRKVKRCLSGCK